MWTQTWRLRTWSHAGCSSSNELVQAAVVVPAIMALMWLACCLPTSEQVHRQHMCLVRMQSA
jgi:hypothetical protein